MSSIWQISVRKRSRKPKVQLRVENLETRAILGSSPRTMIHNKKYNNDEEHGSHQKKIYNSGYLSIHSFSTKCPNWRLNCVFLNRLNYTYYAIYIVGIHYKSKSKSIKTRENNPYSQKIDPFNEYNHNKIQEKGMSTIEFIFALQIN